MKSMLSLDELKNAYDGIAQRYEQWSWVDQYILGLARLRKQLMAKAHGNILDVACGTGLNFPWFPASSPVTAVDLSPQMLEIAKRRAAGLHLPVQIRVMNAQQLEFPDGSFDTVASALSTCTFPDPILALKEMKRVCRKGGTILLLEHGLSSVPWLARYQDRHYLQHYQASAGCRWNQEPMDLVKAAGLQVLASKRSRLGVFHSIEAAVN